MNSASTRLVLTLALLLFPCSAFANMGSPLMMSAGFHLFFGNIFIGYFEWFLLNRFVWRIPNYTILFIVAGNYASAWLGLYVMSWTSGNNYDIHLGNFYFWHLAFVAVSFVFSVVVETPFYWLALRPKKDLLKNILVRTTVVHLVSYTVLICWYYTVSQKTLITSFHIVELQELLPQKNYSIYYISPTNDAVMKIKLEPDPSPIQVLKIEKIEPLTFIAATMSADGAYDLQLVQGDMVSNSKKITPLIENFAARAAISIRINNPYPWKKETATFDANVNWNVTTGFWAGQGLVGTNRSTNEVVELTQETPAVSWVTRHASLLEGGLVVFQFGENQVCLVDLETKRIALVVRGRSPVVTMESK